MPKSSTANCPKCGHELQFIGRLHDYPDQLYQTNEYVCNNEYCSVCRITMNVAAAVAVVPSIIKGQDKWFSVN